MPEKGLLIAFEGGDGSGKSTQSRLFAERIGAIHTRQAGGTDFGAKLRAMTLDPANANISARAEALLYMADRAEQAHEIVRPALSKGQHVVSDRWAYSSMAYQSVRHALSVEDLQYLSDWSTQGLWPDVVVLIDVSPQIALDRAGSTDHYEASGVAVQEGVRSVYRSLAAADPDRWMVIDGEGTVEDVAQRVWSGLSHLLEK